MSDGLLTLEIDSRILPPIVVDPSSASTPGSPLADLIMRFAAPKITVRTPLGDQTSSPWGEPPAEYSPLPLIGAVLVVLGTPFLVGYMLGRG
ncbi:hypothetical protein [Anaeromyxobacter paludicola]|uniref:Uncharacterized protein n=1 Tax=Anaeromyxobacter paludicola TaxID=2918171 RepID=A0ABM7X6Y3_9BACT|nr:hypothetical protein [Anaeromyxobacter paludicola]BDG07599.1 hypothetical protein AMPC_07120 [Anaeromyxobacter paludicola]